MTRASPLPVLLSLLLLPVAAANDHGEPGPDEHVVLVTEFDLGAEHYYVIEDHGALLLFRETNGVGFGGVDGSGLQPAWSCVGGETVVYVWEDQDCETGVKTGPDMQVTNGDLIEAVEDALPAPVGDLIHEIEHEVLG